jgi:predicted transcriptional regulator
MAEKFEDPNGKVDLGAHILSRYPAVGLVHIENIMTENVLSIQYNQKVIEAVEILINKKISGMPVVDPQNKLITIVSEWDLTHLAAIGKLECPIIDQLDKLVPTARILTVGRRDRFKDAFKHFLSRAIRRVVVVDAQGKVEGIVARRDLMKALLMHHRIHNLKIAA